MTDTTRRAIRTLIQGIPAATIVAALHAFGVPLNPAEDVVLVPLLTAVSSFLLNLLEDNTGVSIGPSKQPQE